MLSLVHLLLLPSAGSSPPLSMIVTMAKQYVYDRETDFIFELYLYMLGLL